MKAVPFRFITTLALGFLVAFAPAAFGIESTDNSQPVKTPPRSHPPRAAQNQLEHLAKQLNLTPDQKAKIEPILKDEAQKVRDLRKDTTLSAQERRTKTRDIHQQAAGQVKRQLTPEQVTQFAKLHGAAAGKAPRAHKPAAPAESSSDSTAK